MTQKRGETKLLPSPSPGTKARTDVSNNSNNNNSKSVTATGPVTPSVNSPERQTAEMSEEEAANQRPVCRSRDPVRPISGQTDQFRARAVADIVQKNFANKILSNKTVVKGLIDDTSASLLDNLYFLLLVFTSNKKESEKTTQNIIKISVKIGLLLRGDKFSPEEREVLCKIRKVLHTVAMTLVSFFEVDHTYDRAFVIKYLTELESLLKSLITKHLTEKSVSRVEQIFGVVKTPDFLDNIYVPKKNKEMRDIMTKVVKDLNNCIEAGVL